MAGLVEASQFLHGVLDVAIFEAEHLHHCFHGLLLQVTEKIEEALHIDKLVHTKLYATVDIGGARVARTREESDFHNSLGFPEFTSLRGLVAK
ncbi:putative phospholipase D alpha 1 [Cocos nucifera]|uniref:Putative phospholipase D alpha 1 n=1 Tax=Cocos nucifera TaxID=13894 RepID=A0A8K0HUT3_COCNU|nr:putative phospholipase D alpha 1 [Cocos nucifera]